MASKTVTVHVQHGMMRPGAGLASAAGHALVGMMTRPQAIKTCLLVGDKHTSLGDGLCSKLVTGVCAV